MACRWVWPVVSGALAILAGYAFIKAWQLCRRRQSPSFQPGWQSTEAEDVLKVAYTLEMAETWTKEELTHALGLPAGTAETVIAALAACRWAATNRRGEMHLTHAGRARARELVRAHRLWESYLVEKEGASLHAAHTRADQREHEITANELARLDADLGHPAWDPHGHFIPDPGKREPLPAGKPLSAAAQPAIRFRVVSLLEEPASLLAQLVALGLKPGADATVVRTEPDLLQVCVNQTVIPLARAAARNVFVVPAPVLPVPLGELPVGARARVVEIRGEGKHQRRMLDMGFVPGAELTVVRESPLGDPVQYRIKGSDIAMRRSEADTILVDELRDE